MLSKISLNAAHSEHDRSDKQIRRLGMIRISHMCRQSNVYLLSIVVTTIMNMVLFDYMLFDYAAKRQ